MENLKKMMSPSFYVADTHTVHTHSMETHSMEKILSVKQFSIYQMGYLLCKIPHKLGLRLQLVLPS